MAFLALRWCFHDVRLAPLDKLQNHATRLYRSA